MKELWFQIWILLTNIYHRWVHEVVKLQKGSYLATANSLFFDLFYIFVMTSMGD
ncbi:hypothetical protein Sjap_014529 [Stephania japonica]|uniref:Uncharacterized protein n=1 Tax=Stephania japonica TaxID=461633 RepID=A0AAP0NQ19_9MAGN